MKPPICGSHAQGLDEDPWGINNYGIGGRNRVASWPFWDSDF